MLKDSLSNSHHKLFEDRKYDDFEILASIIMANSYHTIKANNPDMTVDDIWQEILVQIANGIYIVERNIDQGRKKI